MNSNSVNKHSNIECVLKLVDPLELILKIKKFHSLNIKDMSDAELNKSIRDVLFNNGMFSCLQNIYEYPKDTLFFRVKKLKGSVIPNERFCKESDYWETPHCYIDNYGRLNKPYESLLYTCPNDPYLAVQETNIQKDDFFALIKYKALENIKANVIGGNFDYELSGTTDKNAIMIHEIYIDFLQNEFSRDVGEGTEYLYRISEMIAKEWFDLSPRIAQDGWAYTSVKNKEKYNMCFRPNIAHEVLGLCGAMICKLDENEKIKILCVAIGSDSNGNIKFYPIGSDAQTKVFPEIRKDNNF